MINEDPCDYFLPNVADLGNKYLVQYELEYCQLFARSFCGGDRNISGKRRGAADEQGLGSMVEPAFIIHLS